MKFDVLMFDCPWRFNNVKTGGSFTSGAEQVYTADNQGRTTMALADIMALPVPPICEPNCVLALWVPTALKFSHGEPTARRWGFTTYKTTWYWKKTRLGMGYWGRNVVEELLIFVKGSVAPFMLQEPNAREIPEQQTLADRGCAACGNIVPLTLEDTVWRTLPVGEHSAKPEEFRGMLERATGHFSSKHQLEGFGRQTVPGWTVIGNEVTGRDIKADLIDLYRRVE